MADSALAAVLFDMDGTLIDTEKVWEVAIRELAASYGGEISDHTRQLMLGASAETTMTLLHAELDQPWRDPEAGAAWLDARVLELFLAGLDWRPGARELLGTVRAAGLTTGLVTNTRRALVEVVLPMLGRANFDVVVCGDEVPHSKPHPAHYLAATTALGVAPARTVAIEDSPTGIASAHRAGCVVVAVPNETVRAEAADLLAGTGLVVDSLLDVDLATLLALVPAPPGS